MPPGWSTLTCPQCHQPEQLPGENSGNVFLLSGAGSVWSWSGHCGRRMPLLAHDSCRVTSALRCHLMSPHLHVLPRQVWHAPASAKCLVISWAGDISLSWEHQDGIGTLVLGESPQHLILLRLAAGKWVTVPPHLSGASVWWQSGQRQHPLSSHSPLCPVQWEKQQ